LKITISGLSGCGSTTACNNVSKSLNLQVVNYTMRNLAKELGKPFEEIQNEATNNPQYDFMVDARLIKLADEAKDCVVASRLAGWLFDDADLRVWLSASLQTRSKRIAGREGKVLADVMEATRIRDDQNWNRYIANYGVNVNDHEGFDIIVNTEYLTADQVTSLIVAAANLAAENKLHKPIRAAQQIRHVLSEKLATN
jgi:cytidylate kinase